MIRSEVRMLSLDSSATATGTLRTVATGSDDAIYREDHNQTRDRNSAANHSILRRMALNAHNRMPGTANRLPVRHETCGY